MESLRAYNLKLVANILPLHVAKHFLRHAGKKDEVVCTEDFHSDGSNFVSLQLIMAGC